MSINNAILTLKELFGKRLDTSSVTREQHSHSETNFPSTSPNAVIYAKTSDEVSKIVEICNYEDCPVIPWGAGTSLEGNALAVEGGITINMMYMNKVLQINPEDMDVIVQPGLRRDELNRDLRATGLFFSVDPGANASLGGMASTGASGTTSVRYGTMKNNVLALEAVMPDGKIIRTGSRARKSSSGYDLKNIIVGSEGTLAIITELTLALHGQPEAISAAVCQFENINEAVQTVISTIQLGVPIARMELVDEISIQILNSYSKTNLACKPHLFMEFHGTESSVQEQAAMVQDLCREYRGTNFEWSINPEDRTKLWKARHDAFYAYKANYPNHTALVTDICVPISTLAEVIAETKKDILETHIPGPIIGHVGDGNFHSTLMIRDNNKEDLKIAQNLADRMAERALRFGGTVTGEHGIGQGKLKFMEKEHGDGWTLMTNLKKAFDPKGIFNPGKIVEHRSTFN